jgi:hypothetical protein
MIFLELIYDLKMNKQFEQLIPVALKEEMKPSTNYFKGELERILAAGEISNSDLVIYMSCVC